MRTRAVLKMAKISQLENSHKIRIAIERLDQVVNGFEIKWGVNRLMYLVDQDLAEAFHRQENKLKEALANNKSDEVILHTDGMAKGWIALDKAATIKGCQRVDKDVWYIRTPAGRNLALVRDSGAYKAIGDIDAEIWSAKEIGNLVDSFYCECGKGAEILSDVKATFPDATLICLKANG